MRTDQSETLCMGLNRIVTRHNLSPKSLAGLQTSERRVEIDRSGGQHEMSQSKSEGYRQELSADCSCKSWIVEERPGSGVRKV